MNSVSCKTSKKYLDTDSWRTYWTELMESKIIPKMSHLCSICDKVCFFLIFLSHSPPIKNKQCHLPNSSMIVLGANNSFYSFWKGFKVFHSWFLEFFPVEEIVFYWESYFCLKKNDMHAFNYIVVSIALIGETLTGRISVKGVLKNFRGTCPCQRLFSHSS